MSVDDSTTQTRIDATPPRRVTDTQLELLRQFDTPPDMTWHRPMDLGGRDGSNHSSVLAQLERKGLVESMQRSALGGRGSKLYRITSEGVELRAAMRAVRPW